MELKALLASTLVLPSIPRVLALLLNQLERPEPDLKTITQLIGTDPALTVRLMQLSNAPFFKLSGAMVAENKHKRVCLGNPIFKISMTCS